MYGAQKKDRAALTVQLVAVSLLVFGFLAMGGWVFRISVLFQPFPAIVPMAFNTAFCFVLLGLGLLALLRATRATEGAPQWLVAVPGLPMVVLSALVLAQYFTGTNLGVDEFAIEAWVTTGTPNPGRMAPLTAILFILIGLVFVLTSLLSSSRTRVALVMLSGGLVAVTAGTVAVAGYFFGLKYLTGWAGYSPMAVNTAAAFLVAGVGLCAAAMTWNRVLILDRYRWSGFGVFLILMVVGFNIWQGLVNYQVDRIQALTQQAATELALQIDRERVAYVRALNRMVARMEGGGQSYQLPLWEADAQLYLEGYPGIRAMAWLGLDGEVISRISDDGRVLSAEDRIAYRTDPVRSALFNLAVARGSFVASPPVNLAYGGVGALLLVPFRTEDGVAVLLAAVEYQRMFTSMTSGSVPGFLIEIWIDQRQVFTRPQPFPANASAITGTAGITAIGTDWSVVLRPDQVIIRSAEGPLPVVVLILFSLAAVLVAIAMWYASVARRRLGEVLATSQSLQEETQTSSAIWRESRDLLATIDEEGQFIRVSDSAREVLGYAPEELEGRRFVEFVDPADRVRTEAESRAVTLGTQTSNFVNRYRRKDGTIVHLNWSAVWVPALRYVVGVGRDVTDRMLREQRLASSEERLRIALDQSGRVVRDRNGTSGDTQWVGSTAALLGLSQQGLAFLPIDRWLEHVHPDDRARVRALDDAAWRSGSGFRIEYRWIRPDDDRTVWLEDTGAVSGERMVAVLTDVTVKHETEEQLERRVVERTEALARVNAELEAFSYSVSHDLRTPLRAISGFAEILADTYADRLDKEGRHYLQRILDGSARMGTLIDDLLQLGRVARQDIVKQHVNLSALAETVVSGLRDADPARSVEIRIQPGLSARADPRLAEVLLSNLLGNAWKFSVHEQDAVIGLDSDGESFRVFDNGVGFDMEYSGNLFGVFQRLHLVEEFPGTGVGLATVKRIVERHGGRVWAEAEKGKGANFYFTFGL